MSSGSKAHALPHRHSARLGSTLRSVLVQPRVGFERALRTAERRERARASLPEGLSPYLLSLIGGAAGMALWLKIAALAGLRDVPREAYAWTLLVASLVLGAVVGAVAQLVWGVVGKVAIAGLGGGARARDLRLIWGASAFPQVFALFVLVPLDLLIVGPDSFTSERLFDPVSTIWAAISIALAVALSLWSIWLFVSGISVAAAIATGRAAIATVASALAIAVPVAAFVFAARAVTP